MNEKFWLTSLGAIVGHVETKWGDENLNFNRLGSKKCIYYAYFQKWGYFTILTCTPAIKLRLPAMQESW